MNHVESKDMNFYFPINSEPFMIGEAQIPYYDTNSNKITNRCAMSCKDEEFILSRFGSYKTKPIEVTL